MADPIEKNDSVESPDLEIEVAPTSAADEPSPTDSSEPGSTDACAPASREPVEESLQAQLAQIRTQLEESFSRARDTQQKLKDEHERLLRKAAELENYKRRAQKEMEDLGKYSNERLLRDFLPVADNLERALDHADTHEAKVVIDGVRLVQKMLDQALAKHGVTGFSAAGKLFDPALHEALMQQDSDLAPGTVVTEMAKGYKLHDRLIRPAAVVVAKAREPAQRSDNGGAGGGAEELASSLGPENESN